MTRFVIGPAISAALLAITACSGTSPTGPASPSASLSTASPATAAFSAQTFSSGVTSSTLDHGHGGNSGPGSDNNGHDEHGDRGNGREEQLEGAIASIDAAHKSFVVRGTTVNVLPATIIRHGDTVLAFADLVVGARVHVKGAADGTAVAAREIKVQREDGEDADRGEAEGVVSGLAGTCPAITFNVGTLKVSASATTIFGHGGCLAVVNGAQVEVKGAVQSDGSLAASRISAGHEGDDADD